MWCVRVALVMVLAVSNTRVSAQLTDAGIVALSATELRVELAAGNVSARRVTEVFLQRIAALDAAGPTLRAVLEINPDALAIARSLDRRRQRGGPVGALHGVPVLLKANIDTADRMATSAGSLALAEHRAAADAVVVERLRAAGAVILGKTNLSEWANFRSTSSTSGWSSLGGQTRNAYVLDRNPCGSSSGSAVAVAARLAPLAIGTETNGSIVCPAAANGVVGIKPTMGLVSQRGIIPIASSQDTAGPIARTVSDAALLLAAIAERRGSDLARAAGARESVAGVRIGVLRDYSGAGRDAAVEAAYAESLQRLSAAGAELVDPLAVRLGSGIGAVEFAILLFEFRDELGQYLAGVRNGPRSLAALIEFNEEHAADVMPHFGQELLLAAAAQAGLEEPGYRAALAAVTELRSGLDRLFAAHHLDALIAPANGRAWRTDWRVGDAVRVSSSSIAAVSGYPSVVVPATLSADLPIGMAFIGRPGQEAELIALAAAFERRRGEFPAPKFLPSIGE